jgi:Mrp family chromosome partitioning ATPase
MSLAQRRPDVQRGEAVPEPPAVAPAMLEACRGASLQMGAPTMSRLGITSTLRGEGRTSVALAMARVQHEDYGRKVLLVDLDFDNPRLARLCGCRSWPGMAELSRGAMVTDVAQSVEDGITVIAAGAAEGSAPRIVTDLERGKVLDRAAKSYDIVIGDLPPLLGCAYGHSVAGWFADLLLVVRSRTTPVARIREATSHLSVEPRILLNGAQSDLPRWLRNLTGR